jgi:hypothetical protein
MPKLLEEKLKELPKVRQKAIQQRADQLISEEMTLQALRVALEKTQEELSTVLHIKQDGISRLEHRSDMLLSTLSKYISAMGGTLKLTAEFPDRPPVIIQGLAEISAQSM